MQRFYQRLQLQTKIILPFLAVFICTLMLEIVIFGSWFTNSLEQSLRTEVELFADRALQDLQVQQQTLAKQIKLFTRQTIVQEAIAKQDRATILRILLPIKVELNLDWLNVLDKGGNSLVRSFSSQIEGKVLEDETTNDLAIAGTQFDDIINTTDQLQSLLISAAPITNKDGTVGAIVIGSVITNDLLKAIATGSTKEILAIGDNHILAASSSTFLDQDNKNNLIQIKALQSDQLSQRVNRIEVNQNNYLAKTVQFSGLKNTKLSLVILYPIASLDAAQHQLWLQLGGLFILGSGFVILVGSLIARTIASRLNAQFQQLQTALQNLQQTQAQLVQAEKMSGLGQMVAGVAHEINNPVNFIEANLVYLNDYVQDILGLVTLYQLHYPQPVQEITDLTKSLDWNFLFKDISKIITSMKSGAQRISQIVLSLRNFSRLDESDLKSVNLQEGLESTLLVLNHRCQDLEVIQHYENLPLIECYPAQLNQVFFHLLSNAIDAVHEAQVMAKVTEPTSAKKTGTIAIATQQLDSGQIQVSIKDSGIGIPESIATKIFDPFFTTKPVGQGTGMGLAIAYKVIEKHQGTIKMRSQPGQGTAFTITLPITQSIVRPEG